MLDNEILTSTIIVTGNSASSFSQLHNNVKEDTKLTLDTSPDPLENIITATSITIYNCCCAIDDVLCAVHDVV